MEECRAEGDGIVQAPSSLNHEHMKKRENGLLSLKELLLHGTCGLVTEPDSSLATQWPPYSMPGRKIHAGTRHYAVLPLSLAVKPLKYAEGARHDLLPCPDSQNRGKSPCQTDNKPQYLFSLLHA